MTLSLWRYAHLTLAIFSSAFLLIAAITGTILAVDTVQQKTLPYRIAHFDKITVASTLSILQKTYPEITEITIDKNQFVIIQAIDKKGNEINAYIDPMTGKSMGQPKKKDAFIQWITGLHRSLFLHETGRFIIGFNAFLLVLIAISGLVLILKRQNGIRHFFSKIKKDYFAQYYHTLLGRLALIPIIIIALSGTYLSLVRFNFFESPSSKIHKNKTNFTTEIKTLDFKNTLLANVKKIEFPFSDDPDDYYTFELNDRKIEVNQFTNAIVDENLYATSKSIAELSIDLHTGRTNIFWAIILGLASLNIVFFIFSGFTMTLKRRAGRIKNKYTANESEFILLVGSENGSTFQFANSLYNQLIQKGKRVHINDLNNYKTYPNASHLIIFTATYGLGDSPSNATRFTALIDKYPQQQEINFTVVGFGSTAYPDFCQYAKKIDALLEKQPWSNRLIALETVNDKSVEQFLNWITLWNSKTDLLLAKTPTLYSSIPRGIEKMVVVQKTTVTNTEETFLITLRTRFRLLTNFTSGDLLAIYPASDNQERLYSIGKNKKNIQLSVKLHPSGLGSNYLNNLKAGDIINARIIKNKLFHFPKNAPQVALISNGTGIAPFLGMIEENKKKTNIYLYCGFRKETENTLYYQKFASKMIEKKQLANFQIAYSRAENHQYVTDLIRKDISFFSNLLATGGSILICGSIAMQLDIEKLLEDVCYTSNKKGVSYYKSIGQIKTDCY
jgi:sulfite reductase (NADPH) flavoprotein alpha-component